MLYHVNEAETIDPQSQMHYRFHQEIDPSIYPQVHDFYELTLVSSGELDIQTERHRFLLSRGSLILLRPGDIHTRSSPTGCVYINLAFPNRVMMDLFHYLDDPESLQRIVQAAQPLVLRLSEADHAHLQTRLEHLNLLPVNCSLRVNTELRRLILNLMLDHIIPILSSTETRPMPPWLQKLVELAQDPAVFTEDLAYLAALSSRSKEHVCRSFRKYLGCSPTEFLNTKRLNYGANLLLHTDKKIIDVAYDSGFQSLSRFYHAFQKEFQCSPAKYRNLSKV